MYAALSSFAIVLAWTLLLLGVDPVPTWFYVFVWYPTLTLLDAVQSRVGHRPPLLRHPRLVASLLLWSAVIWLVFEAANFRIANWYYVFLPGSRAERWGGILLSFATVVPAVLLAERVLEALGVGRRWRFRPLPARAWELHTATAFGAFAAALAFIWPGTFFPLIWGAVWLLVDPFIYRKRREWSLLGSITQGEWGRIGRLLLGGLGIGLLWELYNSQARGKWVYTVPWLEHTKLFEMPPLGFLGFPVFALEAWTLYHALCVLGVAIAPAQRDNTARLGAGSREPEGGPSGGPLKGRRTELVVRGAAVLGGVLFSLTTLLGMERWTISSTVPRLEALPGITATQAAALRNAGIRSPFALARLDPRALGEEVSGIAPPAAQTLVDAARLSTLRGIGTQHALALFRVGIRSVNHLASRDPAALWQALHQTTAALPGPGGPPDRPTPAEVRVWVRAAGETVRRSGSEE